MNRLDFIRLVSTSILGASITGRALFEDKILKAIEDNETIYNDFLKLDVFEQWVDIIESHNKIYYSKALPAVLLEKESGYIEIKLPNLAIKAVEKDVTITGIQLPDFWRNLYLDHLVRNQPFDVPVLPISIAKGNSCEIVFGCSTFSFKQSLLS